MRIALASDAWKPQINGVVTTLKATAATLSALGHEVRIIRPQERLCLPCPVAAIPVPGPEDVSGVTGVRRADLGEAIPGALRLNRHVCVARAGTFSRKAARSQFPAGLAPVPAALRARVAVSRSSAMIERIAARRHTTSQAGDAN
jgi:hypothetical protein